MPHTLPLRFQVPTKIVHVFVVEYSESLGRCQAGSSYLGLRQLVTLRLERPEQNRELDQRS